MTEEVNTSGLKRLFEKRNLKGSKDNGCWSLAGYNELNLLIKSHYSGLITECESSSLRNSYLSELVGLNIGLSFSIERRH
ncbi:unnamed protein product [Arabis nemorensis]|uniref:Uncharacterized protein n=1 Tax=Arabis nemorensis TaxID=586526 RepID=A0A565CRD6_9BRAS|nr:unnamed protein product [Arabis nemorensis]